MILSTSTDVLAKAVGINDAISLIADSGFDAADYTFGAIDTEHDKDFYTNLKKHAEEKGLFFNQAHAPFPSARGKDDDEIVFNNIAESTKKASYLGIKNIVVHPVHYLSYTNGNAQRIFELSMDFYKKLIPFSEEYGVKIALENMWEFQKAGYKKISHSACSKPLEFLKYLETLNNDCFIACFDIGHATLVCEEHDVFIETLGNKYLKALHVHDVGGFEDDHTLPYFGITNWDKVTKALAKIDYNGDLTYEAGGFFKGKPVQLYPEYLKLMVQTGRFLIKKIEDYKKGL